MSEEQQEQDEERCIICGQGDKYMPLGYDGDTLMHYNGFEEGIVLECVIANAYASRDSWKHRAKRIFKMAKAYRSQRNGNRLRIRDMTDYYEGQYFELKYAMQAANDALKKDLEYERTRRQDITDMLAEEQERCELLIKKMDAMTAANESLAEAKKWLDGWYNSVEENERLRAERDALKVERDDLLSQLEAEIFVRQMRDGE